MSMIELLDNATRRLRDRGEHDLADVLRDIRTTAKACLSTGQPLDALPFIDAIIAFAEGVLAEPDPSDPTDVCAQDSTASTTTTACRGETTAALTAGDCFRQAHEHMQATFTTGIDRQARQLHRLAAEHYLAQACAMAAAKAQGVL